MSTIVLAMKDFSHSDQGDKVYADLKSMLESTLVVARNEYKYVAEVVTNFGEDVPEVPCYRDDLNQVFLNLLVNAAHTIQDVVGDGSNGQGVITVTTEVEMGWVIIKIGDSGKGIPQKIRDRIFDPFFTTKDVGKGTGQGLAIARRIIVEKHKGILEFETQEDVGTTFIIRLPLLTESQEENA